VIERSALPTPAVHVRLEIQAGEDFRGRAISDHQSREFHGWIGLIGAIEALTEQAAELSGRPDVRRGPDRPR
jgi:hypothetical protein